MTRYLQAVCLDCARIYAYALDSEPAEQVRCPFCRSLKRSLSFQISYLEYQDVLCLYDGYSGMA